MKKTILVDAGFKVVKACATIRCYGMFSKYCTSGQALGDRETNYPFLYYAVGRFSSHLTGCYEESPKDIILGLLWEERCVALFLQAKNLHDLEEETIICGLALGYLAKEPLLNIAAAL